MSDETTALRKHPPLELCNAFWICQACGKKLKVGGWWWFRNVPPPEMKCPSPSCKQPMAVERLEFKGMKKPVVIVDTPDGPILRRGKTEES